MGFPDETDLSALTTREANSLVGETMHLSSIGILMYAIYLDSHQPWWSSVGAQAAKEYRVRKKQAKDAAAAAAAAASRGQRSDKRRRLGGVRR